MALSPSGICIYKTGTTYGHRMLVFLDSAVVSKEKVRYMTWDFNSKNPGSLKNVFAVPSTSKFKQREFTLAAFDSDNAVIPVYGSPYTKLFSRESRADLRNALGQITKERRPYSLLTHTRCDTTINESLFSTGYWPSYIGYFNASLMYRELLDPWQYVTPESWMSDSSAFKSTGREATLLQAPESYTFIYWNMRQGVPWRWRF